MMAKASILTAFLLIASLGIVFVAASSHNSGINSAVVWLAEKLKQTVNNITESNDSPSNTTTTTTTTPSGGSACLCCEYPYSYFDEAGHRYIESVYADIQNNRIIVRLKSLPRADQLQLEIRLAPDRVHRIRVAVLNIQQGQLEYSAAWNFSSWIPAWYGSSYRFAVQAELRGLVESWDSGTMYWVYDAMCTEYSG